MKIAVGIVTTRGRENVLSQTLKDLKNEVGKLLEILLKKNSEVNSGLSNETSTNIEQTTKAAS